MVGLQRFVFALVLVALAGYGSIHDCLANSSPERELLVLFKQGTVQLPAGSTGATIDEASISSVGLENALSSVATDSIISAYPSFDRADTVTVGPTGDPVLFLDYSLLYRILLPEGANRDSIAGILRQFPEVVYAELNGRGKAFGPTYPNDPHFVNGDQWGLWNFDHPSADIDAPWAWGTTTGRNTVKIGIIDAGFIESHDEFLNRLSPKSDANPDSCCHGLQVAGVLAAKGSNGIGIAGMDWNAPLYSGRFDISNNVTAADIRTAAEADTAAVLNMSWGITHGGVPSPNETIASALAGAYMLDRVLVAAMGNDCATVVNFPAGFGHGTIAVGSTNSQDVLDPCSTKGPNIDVVAPGVGIWTCTGSNSYTQVSGTSFAAPIVSGIAALLKSAADSLANDDIRAIIRLSARDLTTPGWDPSTGTGRVNARRALEIFRSPNRLVRGVTGSGANPTDVGNDGPDRHMWKWLFGTPQTYYAIRHEVHGHVQFDTTFNSVPYVWGRGSFMPSYNSFGQADYTVIGSDTLNLGMGWCDTIPGTVTASGCSLKTYVYKVWQTRTGNPDLYFWWPCPPAQVRFAWSALEIATSPDTLNSYYVPQAVLGTVKEGSDATRYFFTCPNLDGVLPHNARVKVVVKDANGNGIPGIPAADIFVLFNGGTQAQGFVGEGADSVIANHQWNQVNNCPDLRILPADGPTDASGTTYITFIGAGGQRDPTRKWGHYDYELPVYALGAKLVGRAKTDSAGLHYTLRIRNVDLVGGMFALPDQGERLTIADYNKVNSLMMGGGYDYWADFDENGGIGVGDWDIFIQHYTQDNPHRCDYPNNP